MRDPARFLTAFAQALGALSLYPAGHPSRERAVDLAFEELEGITVPAAFTFLDDEVVFGRTRLRGLKSWDWGPKLVALGIERIEVERKVTREELSGLVQELHSRLTAAVDTREAGLERLHGFRYGPVEVRDDEAMVPAEVAAAAVELALGIEADTLRWLLAEVHSRGSIPLLEAEAVVRSLSVTMHGSGRTVLPLLKLKAFDQYTTTHSLNVAVLAMGLAESVGCSTRDCRALGMAALLHDIGRASIPMEILTKSGPLSDDERALVRRHPVDGARIILRSDDDLRMAAAVAYEHHVMLDGQGYPAMHYDRECTVASRLVHICDVYDALSTDRPYREAWTSDRIQAYLEEHAGTEFDPALVAAFVRTLREGQVRVVVLDDGRA